jgi:hypothetical protein
MDVAALLAEAYGRIGPILHRAVRGLDSGGLTFRPDAEANTLAWLVWHTARVQDAQVADVAGIGQVWVVQAWASRFGLPFASSATGYGQSSNEVALVDAPADLLLGYYDAVAQQTLDFLARLSADDLDDVVDESWDPPVTLGVRLVSILGDDLQHAGQASYVRGLLDRSGS